jgi:hypothetical protein
MDGGDAPVTRASFLEKLKHPNDQWAWAAFERE